MNRARGLELAQLYSLVINSSQRRLIPGNFNSKRTRTESACLLESLKHSLWAILHSSSDPSTLQHQSYQQDFAQDGRSTVSFTLSQQTVCRPGGLWENHCGLDCNSSTPEPKAGRSWGQTNTQGIPSCGACPT